MSIINFQSSIGLSVGEYFTYANFTRTQPRELASFGLARLLKARKKN